LEDDLIQMEKPRDRPQRRIDALGRLESDVDVWVATANADGTPHLVPLSLDWDGVRVVICAERTSLTIENLMRSSVARLGIGPTRDVVMIDAAVEESFAADEISSAMAEHYARRTGWDPRRETGRYVYVCLRPRRIQAWREANEIAGRTLMRNGEWL
jgi:hypothetical protein